MTRSRQAWVLFLLTRLFGLAMDAVVIAFAYLAAVALRFNFGEPMWGWRRVALSYGIVCLIYIAAMILSGCYASAWRRLMLRDVPRYMAAFGASAVILAALRVFLPGSTLALVRFPYSVTVIATVFAFVGVVGARVMWRVWCDSRVRDKELLEREERHFDNSAAARFLLGKTVLVTGSGGTIGSEIVRQVAAAGAKRVILVERCENALYEIDREMRAASYTSSTILPVMADAGNAERMAALFAAEKPDVVLHAAACKHVPMVELNPEEGWRNNAEATRSLAKVAAAHDVPRFVLISTDKAVNPVSVMGQTKREAERIIMAMESVATVFCAVRFGNVFGSSGSVVPLFREQIANRQPVTVTHPEMKRYFMTVQEAVSLVLQAASRTEKAIYTLDMGKSVRILDLAEGMIRQAGFRPYVDIPIVFTGIRPGEKLFEEIDVSEKSCYRTDMAKIYITK